MKTSCVVLAFATALITATVSARPARVWSDAELWKEADVVVLARPKSTKDVTLVAKEPRPEFWIDVETTLEVQIMLKGDAKDEIVFRHARYKEGAIPLPNGPIFVKLDPDKRQQFLLFLKRTEGGVFEPLSGQMDAHDSVRWVQQYGAGRPGADF